MRHKNWEIRVGTQFIALGDQKSRFSLRSISRKPRRVARLQCIAIAYYLLSHVCDPKMAWREGKLQSGSLNISTQALQF